MTETLESVDEPKFKSDPAFTDYPRTALTYLGSLTAGLIGSLISAVIFNYYLYYETLVYGKVKMLFSKEKRLALGLCHLSV